MRPNKSFENVSVNKYFATTVSDENFLMEKLTEDYENN
jgi:hypothetical protein